MDGRACRHVQAAFAACELILSAVLLHRVGQIAHHLVNLPVDRLSLHRLHHLADVVALPLDDGLAHVGHVVRVHAASPSDEVPLHAALPRVVVDVLGVSVDRRLRVVVVVNQPCAERLSPRVAVFIEHERIFSVRIQPFGIRPLRAVTRFRAEQQRPPRDLSHVNVRPLRRRVVLLVPEFQQRHPRVSFRRLPVVRFLLRVFVARYIAFRLWIVLLHPGHACARRLEAAPPILHVLVHRIGVKVFRVPRQHVDHAFAVFHVLVPENLRHPRTRHDGVLHQRLILARPSRAVKYKAHHVVHLFGASRRLFPFRQHHRLRQVVHLIGDHVVHAASQRVARRRGSALFVRPPRPQHARSAHLLVFFAQLVVKAVKQRINPRHQRPFRHGNRLAFRRIPAPPGLPPVARLVHAHLLLSLQNLLFISNAPYAKSLPLRGTFLHRRRLWRIQTM